MNKVIVSIIIVGVIGFLLKNKKNTYIQTNNKIKKNKNNKPRSSNSKTEVQIFKNESFSKTKTENTLKDIKRETAQNIYNCHEEAAKMTKKVMTDINSESKHLKNIDDTLDKISDDLNNL